MNGEKYSIVFSGEILPGQDVETVKEKVAALYKVPVDRCNNLFVGKPIVMKKDISFQQAQKYKRAFVRIGAVCHIREMGDSTTKKEDSSPEDKTQRKDANEITTGTAQNSELLVNSTEEGKPSLSCYKLLPHILHKIMAIAPESNYQYLRQKTS